MICTYIQWAKWYGWLCCYYSCIIVVECLEQSSFKSCNKFMPRNHQWALKMLACHLRQSGNYITTSVRCRHHYKLTPHHHSTSLQIHYKFITNSLYIIILSSFYIITNSLYIITNSLYIIINTLYIIIINSLYIIINSLYIIIHSTSQKSTTPGHLKVWVCCCKFESVVVSFFVAWWTCSSLCCFCDVIFLWSVLCDCSLICFAMTCMSSYVTTSPSFRCWGCTNRSVLSRQNWRIKHLHSQQFHPSHPNLLRNPRVLAGIQAGHNRQEIIRQERVFLKSEGSLPLPHHRNLPKSPHRTCRSTRETAAKVLSTILEVKKTTEQRAELLWTKRTHSSAQCNQRHQTARFYDLMFRSSFQLSTRFLFAELVICVLSTSGNFPLIEQSIVEQVVNMWCGSATGAGSSAKAVEDSLVVWMNTHLTCM